ncbi:MAG: GAF domain-containing protein [Salinivirgaceae bacterium]|nr:GAF domain-containing protein [Salinivirgaceae bacterium]
MKARFTITNRLIVGFGILLLATLLNGILTYSTLNESQDLNEKILTNYNPSAASLQELTTMVNNSYMLTKNWVFIEKQPDTPDKKKLIEIHQIGFPALKEEITKLSRKWEPGLKKEADSLLNVIGNQLFVEQKSIIDLLQSFESYDDFMVIVEVTPKVEEGGTVTILANEILNSLAIIQTNMDNQAKDINIQMSDSFRWFQKFILFAILLVAIFVLGAAYFTTRSIVFPIMKLKEFLLTMTRGVLPKEKMETNNDEIGDMASALNLYIENMRRTSEFAVEIGKGNYDTKFEALSEEDMLGNALIEMRQNLKQAVDQGKERARVDEIRNWVTKGLADFGDILRQNSDNMDRLSKSVMNRLIDYIGANQGAMYILNELDEKTPYFEMKSAIAYGREKFLKQNFEMKEGLVGRCAFEKLPVYLKEIPGNYIHLTSGLGTAEPDFLLLVPLVFNDKVLGVIELASFTPIETYQTEFIISLGENIASTISNVRINEQTKHLLEESKLRGDELSAQEEELRQNMEELQATQEEAARREMEMLNTIDAINNTLGTIEIDRHGNINSVNDNFLAKTRLDAGSMIGKSFQEFFAGNELLEKLYVEIWSGLHIGESGSMTTNFITTDAELWFRHTFTPFKNKNGELNKVIDLIVDISDQKHMEKELENIRLHSR